MDDFFPFAKSQIQLCEQQPPPQPTRGPRSSPPQQHAVSRPRVHRVLQQRLWDSVVSTSEQAPTMIPHGPRPHSAISIHQLQGRSSPLACLLKTQSTHQQADQGPRTPRLQPAHKRATSGLKYLWFTSSQPAILGSSPTRQWASTSFGMPQNPKPAMSEASYTQEHANNRCGNTAPLCDCPPQNLAFPAGEPVLSLGTLSFHSPCGSVLPNTGHQPLHKEGPGK